MHSKTTLIILGLVLAVTGCHSEQKTEQGNPAPTNTQKLTPAVTTAPQETNTPFKENLQQKADKLPFAENIVAYYRAKQNDELSACRGSNIALQADNPNANCYDKLDAAFIKPRIIYQNHAVALLSTKNMFGMGNDKVFGVELIALKKGAIVPLWGALGSDFTIGEKDHQLNIHYKTTEFSRSVEKDKTINF